MKKNSKRIVTSIFVSLLSMTALFADASLGFNNYFKQIIGFLQAIGGVLLIASVGIWALKAIVQRNIKPEDWKAIAFTAVGGIVLIIAPTIVGSVFSDLGGLN